MLTILVVQDYVEVMKWWRRSAEQGHALAQYSFGIMYAEGQGVARDFVQAHKWFNLSAARVPASDRELRERAAKSRDAVAAKMPPAQITEAQRLAREWKPKPERP